jgi:hypothetical protein
MKIIKDDIAKSNYMSLEGRVTTGGSGKIIYGIEQNNEHPDVSDGPGTNTNTTSNENKPDGGPAYPTRQENGCNSGEPGMTLRQYASIKLKVPDSGTDWLDDMIRKSLRDDLAGKAMQEFCTNRSSVLYREAADEAYQMADAMRATREVK